MMRTGYTWSRRETKQQRINTEVSLYRVKTFRLAEKVMRKEYFLRG